MDPRTFRRFSVGQRRLHKALALIEELIIKAKMITGPHEASPPATLVNPSAPTKTTGGSIIHPSGSAPKAESPFRGSVNLGNLGKPSTPSVTPTPKKEHEGSPAIIGAPSASEANPPLFVASNKPERSEAGLVTHGGKPMAAPSMGPGSYGHQPATKTEHEPPVTVMGPKPYGPQQSLMGPSQQPVTSEKPVAPEPFRGRVQMGPKEEVPSAARPSLVTASGAKIAAPPKEMPSGYRGRVTVQPTPTPAPQPGAEKYGVEPAFSKDEAGWFKQGETREAQQAERQKRIQEFHKQQAQQDAAFAGSTSPKQAPAATGFSVSDTRAAANMPASPKEGSKPAGGARAALADLENRAREAEGRGDRLVQISPASTLVARRLATKQGGSRGGNTDRVAGEQSGEPGPLPGEEGYKPVNLPPSGWDPFKKLSQRPGPNVMGWYGFGHGLGMTAASPGGGPTQLGMLTGRAVAQVHGLLNRRAGAAPRAYRGEMTRFAREGELTRRQQLGRMQGEAGGVVTQSAMARSLFVQVGEELAKSRIKPKRPKSRLFVSIYSNPALFGRGKKEKDDEPTAELPSLMPKTPKPRTITLFGKAKEVIPDPQTEDLQPDEEDGVASALVGDDDLVVKADRVAKLRAHYAERKRLWSLIPSEHRGPDEEGLPHADGPYAHLREPIAAHDYAAHLHGVAGRDPSRQREADEASHQAWIESNKISKAGAAQESTGRWTLEDPIQAKREYEHGFERQPLGVSGGQTPDLPERGRDWHGTVPGVPDEPQDDDEEPAEETWGPPKPILESEKKEKKPESVIKKALVPYQFAQQRARDILKALPDLSVGPDLTPREMEFLKSQGLDDEDIIRGSYRITPRMQTEFRRYMTDRVFKSLSGLRRSW